MEEARASGLASASLAAFLGDFFSGPQARSCAAAAGRRNSVVTYLAGLTGFPAGRAENAALDNKSEFQVMLDMPEGTPVEQTHVVLQQLATEAEKIPK